MGKKNALTLFIIILIILLITIVIMIFDHRIKGIENKIETETTYTIIRIKNKNK